MAPLRRESSGAFTPETKWRHSGEISQTVACELTLECGIISAPVVMNELRRLIAPHLPAAAIAVPDGIALTMEPLADCQRYDYLLGSTNVH